jgi:hypothetical protein
LILTVIVESASALEEVCKIAKNGFAFCSFRFILKRERDVDLYK